MVRCAEREFVICACCDWAIYKKSKREAGKALGRRLCLMGDTNTHPHHHMWLTALHIIPTEI
jgi:hypothetical protein